MANFIIGSSNDQQLKQYWLTTPRLNLTSSKELSITVGDDVSLKIFHDKELDRYRKSMEKRLHQSLRANDLYIKKLELFRGRTYLSMEISHTDDSIIRKIGHRYEMLLFLTEAFSMKRSELHKKLGIAKIGLPSTDLILPIENGHWTYKSKFSTETLLNSSNIQGLNITSKTKLRLKKLGLNEQSLINLLVTEELDCETIQKVHVALHWAEQSLMEKDLSAALIKTCIGFECLYGPNDREYIKKSISERTAFLLGRSNKDRDEIVKIMKEFYKRRSDIVHSGKKIKEWDDKLQQRFDRLLFISAIALASLSKKYPSNKSLQSYFKNLTSTANHGAPAIPTEWKLVRKVYKS